MKHKAFPAGQEAQKIHALWKAARQKVLLNEQWLHTLLIQESSSLSQRMPLPDEDASVSIAQPRDGSHPEHVLDRGDALSVPSFYGRQSELTTLVRWMLQERCRVVGVFGMGGIGKSALMITAMHHLAEHFEIVIWRVSGLEGLSQRL